MDNTKSAQLFAQISKLRARRDIALGKLLVAARPIVAGLKDHKLDNSALELSAVIFDIDAAEADMILLAQADPVAFIETMVNYINGPGRE